jgi:hypothetical protein
MVQYSNAVILPTSHFDVQRVRCRPQALSTPGGEGVMGAAGVVLPAAFLCKEPAVAVIELISEVQGAGNGL